MKKQMMKRKTQIHNFGFLISPTTHLFPLAEYETLKYNKGNYLKIKLQIFFKMLAKKRIISVRSLKI